MGDFNDVRLAQFRVEEAEQSLAYYRRELRREVAMLHDELGFSYQMIAVKLDLSRSRVQQLCEAGRKLGPEQ